MRFRLRARSGGLRCQHDVKRNGYWTGRQCEWGASWWVDGVAMCGTHMGQLQRWALAAGREIAVVGITAEEHEHGGVFQQNATIGP